MSIDITNDTLLSPAEVCEILPRRGGKKVHRSTVWRWCTIGCDGIRLAHVRLGRNVYTTAEALNAFAEGTSKRAPHGEIKGPSKIHPPKLNSASVETAKRKLAKDGI